MPLKQILRKITSISNPNIKGQITFVLPKMMRCSPHQTSQVSQWQSSCQCRRCGFDPMEKKRATHSGILAQEIPLTEEPGGLQSMELQKVKNNLGTKQLMLSLVCLSTPQYLLNHESQGHIPQRQGETSNTFEVSWSKM